MHRIQIAILYDLSIDIIFITLEHSSTVTRNGGLSPVAAMLLFLVYIDNKRIQIPLQFTFISIRLVDDISLC